MQYYYYNSIISDVYCYDNIINEIVKLKYGNIIILKKLLKRYCILFFILSFMFPNHFQEDDFETMNTVQLLSYLLICLITFVLVIVFIVGRNRITSFLNCYSAVLFVFLLSFSETGNVCFVTRRQARRVWKG